MDYKEFQDTIHRLNEATQFLADTYEENGGEITEETGAAEEVVKDLRELLTTEGVDMLGRWLKAREDERQTLKEEKGYIDGKIKTLDETIAFIKARIYDVLQATGTTKVKGTHGYTFTQRESRTVTVDGIALKDRYQEAVTHALADILPPDVTVTLKASVSTWKERNGDAAELPDYYIETVTPTVTFLKPRKTEE